MWLTLLAHRKIRARSVEVGRSYETSLIAGNGRFPFLLLDAAARSRREVVVAAIKEETDPEMNERAQADPGVRVYWLSLGELSRLIETLIQKEGVRRL